MSTDIFACVMLMLGYSAIPVLPPLSVLDCGGWQCLLFSCVILFVAPCFSQLSIHYWSKASVPARVKNAACYFPWKAKTAAAPPGNNCSPQSLWGPESFQCRGDWAIEQSPLSAICSDKVGSFVALVPALHHVSFSIFGFICTASLAGRWMDGCLVGWQAPKLENPGVVSRPANQRQLVLLRHMISWSKASFHSFLW